ncbi:MAG: TVP38/TMEM64 family protein [Verrucomicrobiales bacterium]|nr:TVP38/TMEM64 family protein [Verrucomicrobiales bacterium]
MLPRTMDRETSLLLEGAFALSDLRAGLDPAILRDWAERIRDFGPAAPAVFVLLFVLNTILCLPTAVLATVAGFVFGLGPGLAYTWIGAMAGASAAFAIAGRIARRRIEARIAGRPLLVALAQAVSEEGWKIVFLARLAPGSPFFLLNYLFGITRIRFLEYFWSTAISILPGTALLVYLGSFGDLALSARTRSPAEWAYSVAGFVALAGAIALITRRAKQLLRQKLRPPDPPQPLPSPSPLTPTAPGREESR